MELPNSFLFFIATDYTENTRIELLCSSVATTHSLGVLLVFHPKPLIVERHNQYQHEHWIDDQPVYLRQQGRRYFRTSFQTEFYSQIKRQHQKQFKTKNQKCDSQILLLLEQGIDQ